jgi:hypothetical protein
LLSIWIAPEVTGGLDNSWVQASTIATVVSGIAVVSGVAIVPSVAVVTAVVTPIASSCTRRGGGGSGRRRRRSATLVLVVPTSRAKSIVLSQGSRSQTKGGHCQSQELSGLHCAVLENACLMSTVRKWSKRKMEWRDEESRLNERLRGQRGLNRIKGM